MIKISTYGNYQRNYGTHAMKVKVGMLTLYFSYETIVAFEDDNQGLKVVENSWGPTTGRHLNLIDGGNTSKRLSSEDFQKALDKVIDKHKL